MTNGFQSYALFTYECGKLQWSGNADIGFKANSRLFDIRTMSGSTANSIACVNSPDSIWSNLIYQLRKLLETCLLKFFKNHKNLNSLFRFEGATLH